MLCDLDRGPSKFFLQIDRSAPPGLWHCHRRQHASTRKWDPDIPVVVHMAWQSRTMVAAVSFLI